MRLAEELKAWIEANPLRRWRLRRGLSQMNVASLIGASAKSVGLWENGAAVPSMPSFTLLATLTGRTPSGLRIGWTEWEKTRPAIAGD